MQDARGKSERQYGLILGTISFRLKTEHENVQVRYLPSLALFNSSVLTKVISWINLRDGD